MFDCHRNGRMTWFRWGEAPVALCDIIAHNFRFLNTAASTTGRRLHVEGKSANTDKDHFASHGTVKVQPANGCHKNIARKHMQLVRE